MIETQSHPKTETTVEPQTPTLASCSALGRTLSANKWAQCIEIGVVFSPALLVIGIFQVMPFKNPMFFIGALWIANVAMMLLIWLGVRLRGESLQTVGLSFDRPSFSGVAKTVLWSIPIFVSAVVAFIFGSIVMANIVGIPEGANLSEFNYLQGNLPMLLVSLAGVYVVASFGEELVYRGFLVTRLQQLFGGETRVAVISALVFSSLVFGFAHFSWGPMGIGQTTFMGGALGIAYLLSKRNLWPLILAHGYMDTLLLTQLYFPTDTAG